MKYASVPRETTKLLKTIIMKTKKTILFLLSLVILFPFFSQAQETNISERFPDQNFTGLIVGGYYKIYLFNGEPKLVIHAKPANVEKVKTELRNGVLEITNRPIRQSKAIRIDIYSDYISEYDISGAVVIVSEEVQKPDHINFEVSGAAQVNLEVETGDIHGKISGASILELTGTAKSISCNASGASILKTSLLETESSDIVVSDAAGLIVTDKRTEIPEDKEINYDNEIAATDEEGEKTTYGVTYDGSTARAKFLGIHVNVDEDDETGEVRVGTHKWVYDSEGEVTHKRIRLEKFNGHWGGLGLGINGYVNEKYVYELPQEYEYLDLLWQKSVNIDLNIYEQNINLSQHRNFGIVTGIGYSINNYRFTKSFTVMQDSNYFVGAYNKGVNVRKSKIVTNFITIPVLFEFQDKNPSPLTKHRWHVSLGAIFGVRVHAHQKTYFNELDKDYKLADPVSGDIIATTTSPSYPKAKVHDNFYMRPFKVDASLRVGWGWINLYANVALTEMFNSGKGPKLYPFSVGIMLVSW